MKFLLLTLRWKIMFSNIILLDDVPRMYSYKVLFLQKTLAFGGIENLIFMELNLSF